MSRRTARRKMALRAAAVKPAPKAEPAAPKKVVAQPAEKAPAKKVVKKAVKKED